LSQIEFSTLKVEAAYFLEKFVRIVICSKCDGSRPDSNIRMVFILINTDGETDGTLSSARATMPSTNPAEGQDVVDGKTV
jgi:hypothetical protein